MRKLTTVLVLSLLVGCGYSTGSLIDSRHCTVYLPIWKTQERRRDLEVALTQALLQAIETHTDLKVVSSRQTADTVLEGRILSLQERVLTEDLRDNVQEERVILTVNFSWKETATGKVILERRGFSTFADAALPLGESELTASHQAMHKLAEKIVEQLQQEW